MHPFIRVMQRVPLVLPRRGALLLLSAALLTVCGAVRAAQLPSRYQVEAVFLLNFTHFVQWPPDAFSTANAPFVIGLIGTDPFGRNLSQAVHGERAGTHPIVVTHIDHPDEIGHCQMLFIAPNATGTAQVLAATKGRPILTVSDVDTRATQQVMIGLLVEGEHIHLHIDVDAARASHLLISSSLLQLAEIVGGRPGGN